MAKYKSYREMEAQKKRIMDMVRKSGKHDVKLAEYVLNRILSKYKTNIYRSNYSKWVDKKVEEALEEDKRTGRDYLTTSVPAGKDRYGNIVWVAEPLVNHSHLEDKVNRYHFTRNVYQGGEKENDYGKKSSVGVKSAAKGLSAG